MRTRVFVLLCASLGGLVAGAVISQVVSAAEGGVAVAFADGTAIFCSEGDPLTSNIGVDDPEFPGFDSPEAAREAFLTWARLPAAGAHIAPEIRDEFVEALRPLSDLDLPVETAVSADTVYFDLPGANGNLQARLVVESAGGRYFLGPAYICSSALTDPAKWTVFEEAARDLEVGQ